MTMVLSSIDIGSAGESHFRAMAADCGLVCSKPDNDVLGWDILVEIPPIEQDNLPQDQLLEYRKFFVQVKSTKSSSFSALNTKLSSLKHLALQNYPSIVILVDLRSERPTISGVHLGFDALAFILKRIRLAESQERSLNKIFVNLRRLKGWTLLSKENLMSYLNSIVHPGQSEYLVRKAEVLRDCGYPEGRHKMNLSFKLTHYTELIKALTGESDGVRAKIEQHSETRFGIELPQRAYLLPGAEITIKSKPVFQFSGEMTVANKRINKSVICIADVYISSMENLYFYAKLKSNTFDIKILFDFVKGTVSIKFEPICECAHILDLLLLCKLSALLPDPDSRVSIKNEDTNFTFPYQARHEENPRPIGNAMRFMQFYDEFVNLAKRNEIDVSISKEKFESQLEENFESWQRAADAIEISCEFEERPVLTEENSSQRDVRCTRPVAFCIGSLTIIQLLFHEGEMTIKGSSLKLKLSKGYVIEEFVCQKSEVKFLTEQKLDNIVANHRSKTPHVVLGLQCVS